MHRWRKWDSLCLFFYKHDTFFSSSLNLTSLHLLVSHLFHLLLFLLNVSSSCPLFYLSLRLCPITSPASLFTPRLRNCTVCVCVCVCVCAFRVKQACYWTAGYHGDRHAVSVCVCVCVMGFLSRCLKWLHKLKGWREGTQTNTNTHTHTHTHTHSSLVSFRLTESEESRLRQTENKRHAAFKINVFFSSVYYSEWEETEDPTVLIKIRE